MACFLVPAAEAVVTSVATKVMKKDEKAKIVLLYNKQSTVLQCSPIIFISSFNHYLVSSYHFHLSH